MENLGDILKKLDDTNSFKGNNGDNSKPFAPTDQIEECKVCDGRGWYTDDVPAGHPEFGKIITCICRHDQFENERISRLLTYSNLGHLARFTFDRLKPEGLDENEEARALFNMAFNTSKEYAGDPAGWLILTGPNGSGKTHLAAAIANQCIQDGYIALFIHVPDLLDHLRASFSSDTDSEYRVLLEQVMDVPILILDGLGSHITTPWAQEKLHQIINHRYNAEMPTVVTTSLEIGDLSDYVRSRVESPSLSQIVIVAQSKSELTHRLGRVDPEMLTRMTFSSFNTHGNNPNAHQVASLESTLDAARNFASSPDGWLTIYGETGVGKTHLAVAIASEIIERGEEVFFAFVPELLDYLRYTFTPESRVTYDKIFDEVKNARVLIMDDLGQEHSSPWAQEKLYQIIVHRHNSRLATVITSMVDFSEETGPIGSRIQDPGIGQLVNLDAPDFRIKKRRSTPKRRSR